MLANNSQACSDSLGVVLAYSKMSRLFPLPLKRPGDPPTKPAEFATIKLCKVRLANDSQPSPESVGAVLADSKISTLSPLPWERPGDAPHSLRTL